MAISCVTRIDESMNLRGLQPLPKPGQQIPLPLFAQQGIGQVVEMHPLAGLAIPSATGGNDRQMGIVLAIAPMGLDHYDVAALEVTATDPCEDVIQARDATAHKGTQHNSGVLIEGGT